MAVPSNGSEGKASRFAAGGQQNVPRFQNDLLGVGALDGDLAFAHQPTGADVGGDLVLLEQKGDAVGQPLDDAILAFEHGGEVEA